MPKKTKYRKMQRGRTKGLAKARNLNFGDFGLVSLEPGWISAKQIESARITISRKLKKGGKLFLRIFPDKPVTKKPAETRMGKGKGNPEFWVCVIKRNRILFEVSELDAATAKDVLRSASYKLPLKTKIISKIEQQQQKNV